MSRKILAIDLGASSGRGIACEYDGTKLNISELNRFSNGPKQLEDKYYWDFPRLIENIYESVSLARQNVSSIGIDTWGVDFGLLDRNGCLLSNPRSYRDPAFNPNNMKEVADFFGGEDILFDQTSVALLEYNSLCQLFSMIKHDDSSLAGTEHILMMPNLIEYVLSGTMHSEYSIVSTSQLFDMKRKKWSDFIIEKMDLDSRIFSEVDYAGKKLGKLKPQNRISPWEIDVISVAGHDTACAVVSVPSYEDSYTFISSGSMSLMGIVSKDLLTGTEIIQNKIGNEGAAIGGYRPTVNINGLWIIQECKRRWDIEGKSYSFADIEVIAHKQPAFKSYIDTDHFMNPGDYPQMIINYCMSTNQYIPQTDGEIARCIYDSLAMKYKQTYQNLKKYMTYTDKIYIVGGGVKDNLLNQLTADALGIQVITGPSEATAVGNVLIQLESLGEISGRIEAAEIIGSSFRREVYEPCNPDIWDSAFAEYQRIVTA